MARAVLREMVFGLAATGLLLGCVEGGGKTGAGDGAGVISSPKKSGSTDVEAPEVFQATDSALWDGRPSLGGIWVAAPDVLNPERVLMFNPATGKSVTGALFKRERDNPGPRLQLSSDAAEALGILAGQPTEIKVTALRKEEVAEPVPAAVPATTTDADATDPAAKGAKAEDTKAGEAAAIASAALDAVDAEKAGADPDSKAADPAAVAAGTAAAVAEGATDAAAATVDATPKKKTWKERRAEAKAAREAKKKAAAEAKAAAAAAAAGATAPVEGEAPIATPDAAAAAIAPIESAPLDARKADVTKDAAKASDKAAKTKTKPVADVATTEPAAPAEPAIASGPARPIQVASFSKEDNAKRAAEALAKIGITATPQKSEKGGKAVWGVVVNGDEAMLKKIKDAGFADAYFLK